MKYELVMIQNHKFGVLHCDQRVVQQEVHRSHCILGNKAVLLRCLILFFVVVVVFPQVSTAEASSSYQQNGQV